MTLRLNEIREVLGYLCELTRFVKSSNICELARFVKFLDVCRLTTFSKWVDMCHVNRYVAKHEIHVVKNSCKQANKDWIGNHQQQTIIKGNSDQQQLLQQYNNDYYKKTWQPWWHGRQQRPTYRIIRRATTCTKHDSTKQLTRYFTNLNMEEDQTQAGCCFILCLELLSCCFFCLLGCFCLLACFCLNEKVARALPGKHELEMRPMTFLQTLCH